MVDGVDGELMASLQWISGACFFSHFRRFGEDLDREPATNRLEESISTGIWQVFPFMPIHILFLFFKTV